MEESVMVDQQSTPMKRPKLAVIVTSYGEISHGDCICTKLLEGLEFEDRVEPPRCEVAAIHLMELAKDDIGVEMARRHGVPTHHSVAAALCRGGDELAVDGVVVIGEHGTYPWNEKEQHLYPRRELFDQVVGVFRQSGRVVPVFNDKHLSWNWAWARHMWRTVQELQIPFMAGSSLPFAPFEPAVPLPQGENLDPMVAFGYAGLESYGFHALETAQFVVEQRAGGEVGVRSVECLSGARVWEAHRDGRWPRDIAAAAFAAVREPKGRPQDYTENVHAFDIEYLDGQRLTVFMLNGYCAEFGFAYRVTGSTPIVAASYKLDPRPRRKHFSALVRAMEEMFLTGSPVIPPERTYLTTGILAHLMESHYQGGVRLSPPDLDIAYTTTRLPSRTG
jgi:hypothetical protein